MLLQATHCGVLLTTTQDTHTHTHPRHTHTPQTLHTLHTEASAAWSHLIYQNPVQDGIPCST